MNETAIHVAIKIEIRYKNEWIKVTICTIQFKFIFKLESLVAFYSYFIIRAQLVNDSSFLLRIFLPERNEK